MCIRVRCQKNCCDCQQALLTAVTQQQNRGREYGLRRSAYLTSRGACAPREPFLVIELILRPFGFANVNILDPCENNVCSHRGFHRTHERPPSWQCTNALIVHCQLGGLCYVQLSSLIHRTQLSPPSWQCTNSALPARRALLFCGVVWFDPWNAKKSPAISPHQ